MMAEKEETKAKEAPKPEGEKKPEGAKKDTGGKKKDLTAEGRPASTPQSRLLVRFREEIVPALMKEFGWSNPFQVPRLEKVVINMGVGDGARDIKIIEAAAQDLTIITGQKPVITRARTSQAAYKLRTGRHDGDPPREQDVRVPGQAFQPCAAEGQGLPGPESELAGRDGEFHIRDTRAARVPGD